MLWPIKVSTIPSTNIRIISVKGSVKGFEALTPIEASASPSLTAWDIFISKEKALRELTDDHQLI